MRAKTAPELRNSQILDMKISEAAPSDNERNYELIEAQVISIIVNLQLIALSELPLEIENRTW